MCCSFNIKAAEDVFSDSHFSALVKQLQAEDSNSSYENSTLPDWYVQNNEPRTQPGINMGLEVILDAYSNMVESISISNDIEGFTALITDPGDFPLTNLRGFNIRAINITTLLLFQLSALIVMIILSTWILPQENVYIQMKLATLNFLKSIAKQTVS